MGRGYLHTLLNIIQFIRRISHLGSWMDCRAINYWGGEVERKKDETMGLRERGHEGSSLVPTFVRVRPCL